MPILARTFFSATVALPAATATSMATLMEDSISHWGTNDSGSLSLDSYLGSEASVTPDATIYVGHDAQVRDADNGAATPPEYKGITLATNENYSLQDFGMRGIIDPKLIYFYAAGGANVEIVFQGA